MNDEDKRLRSELMKMQIDHERLDIERIRQQMRWEPWKALAAMAAAVAAMTAAILGLSHFIH